MSLIRRIFPPTSFIGRHAKYILIFLNGLLLAMLLHFYIEKQYEDSLFGSLAAYVQQSVENNPSGTEDSLLINSVHLVHSLGANRLPIFGQFPAKGIKADIIQPVSFDLSTAQGACGSHSYVLGRLLQQMNIDVRFPQMTVANQPAGHIIVEARTSYGWVTLDALSDVFFTNASGRLAGFNEVKNDWNTYKQQVPADYNMSYSYDGARYTNWDKIPVVMPLLKSVMSVAIGKETTEHYSFRSLFLNKYKVLFNMTLGAYLLVLLFTINAFLKSKRKVQSLKTAAAGLPATPAEPLV